MLKSDGSSKVKNAQNFFSKYLKDIICKIKEILNYILMIISQNILAILTTLLNLKKVYETLYTKETISKAATTKFISKIFNRKKISTEHFNLFEAKISLDEIIKSINSKTNNKSSSNYVFTAELYKHFPFELATVLLDVYKFWENLCTMGVTSRAGIMLWSYIKKMIKRKLQTAEPYTIILKVLLQTTLDIIIGENQSAAIQKIEQLDIFFLLFVT